MKRTELFRLSDRYASENRAAALIILAQPSRYRPDSGMAIWAAMVLAKIDRIQEAKEE